MALRKLLPQDTVYRALKELGFSHVSARPKAYKQDPEAMEAFKKTFPPAYQRTQSTYLFGAVCPERGTGAALVLPACNTETMQLHLDEIATKVARGAHAIVILDQAGWHGAKGLKIPSNLSLLPLPPRAPELNSQENIWQFMRQNWLSNRIFKSFDDMSITAVTPGTPSSISPGKSCQSPPATGPSPVNHCEDWY